MTDLAKPTDAEDITKLLIHYSFDLDGCSPEQLIQHWLARYPVDWIRLAVVEALYQGRYKVISVEQILAIWQRRQKPIPHFNGEFQRIVSSRLPKNLREKFSTEADTDRSVFSADGFSSERWLYRAGKARSDAFTPATGRNVDASKDAYVVPLSSSKPDAELGTNQPKQDLGNSWVNGSSAHSSHETRNSVNGHSAEVVAIDTSFQRAVGTEHHSADPDERLLVSISKLEPPPDANPTDFCNGNGYSKAPSDQSDPKTAQWSVNYPVRTTSISQFVPHGRSSGFYSRLKAVVQRHDFTPPSTESPSTAEPTDLYDSSANADCESPFFQHGSNQ